MQRQWIFDTNIAFSADVMSDEWLEISEYVIAMYSPNIIRCLLQRNR